MKAFWRYVLVVFSLFVVFSDRNNKNVNRE